MEIRFSKFRTHLVISKMEMELTKVTEIQLTEDRPISFLPQAHTFLLVCNAFTSF